MTQTIIIILSIFIILLLLYRPSRQTLAGICSVALGQSLRKRKNKDMIIEMFNQKTEISNMEIAQVLKVSDRSVTRYMEELEKEGLVEQVGSTGRNVVYRLKR